MMMARLPLMMALDADGDGEISSSEIEGAVAALKKLDKNSDGKLTTDELMPEGMRGPFGPGGPGLFDTEEMVNRMMLADANNDGFLDQQEMPERMKRMMLERADTDKDGKLSREELTTAVSQMGIRRGAGRDRDGAGQPERPRLERDGTDQPERPRRPRGE